MNLQPLGNNILVRPFPPATESKGGIIIPPSAQGRPDKSTVLAKGEGLYSQLGELIPIKLEVGDVVFTVKGSGTPVEHEGELLYIHREADCLSRVPYEKQNGTISSKDFKDYSKLS